ncbi:MAG: hypothetical protein IKA54_00315 [Clostridia bacterium]|nr:hypothetical protein [Clostridia bacterium]
MKKHSILTSILIIVMCLSMTVGGTYAMFATESKVNVAITLGKVDVEAYLKGDIKLSSSYGYNLPETIANYNEETKQIEVSNMVPGDQIDFTISVVNKSTVSAKYQVFVKIQGDDAVNGKFEVKALGNTITGAIDYEDPTWTDIEPSTDSEPFIDVPVSVALPTDDVMSFDGEEQGQNIAITFGVRAVQGNVYFGPTAQITDIPETSYPEFNDQEMMLLDGTNGFPALPEEVVIESLWEFKATETVEEAQAGEYSTWLGDFLIETDKDIGLGQLGLMGQLPNFSWFNGWISFANPVELKAGQSLPMLTTGFQLMGIGDIIANMQYPAICELETFNCGVFRTKNEADYEAGLKGATITVKLVLFDGEHASSVINKLMTEGIEGVGVPLTEQEALAEIMNIDTYFTWGKTIHVVSQTIYTFE